MKNFTKDGDVMSCEEYVKAYKLMTDEERNLMNDLYMKGVNHDGHSWNTYGDIESVVGKIILGRTGKWLYRLESTNPDNGLWYDLNNNLVWGIGKLPSCKTKDLPMGYDERYHKDGKNWFSSCSNIEDLAHWYSLEDAVELINQGFVFAKYLAVDYVEYENETTFLKETAIDRVEIDIKEIWK
jgi:hypothetical protein